MTNHSFAKRLASAVRMTTAATSVVELSPADAVPAVRWSRELRPGPRRVAFRCAPAWRPRNHKTDAVTTTSAKNGSQSRRVELRKDPLAERVDGPTPTPDVGPQCDERDRIAGAKS